MSLVSIDIRCHDCDHVWDDLVERVEQNDPFFCIECQGENAHKTFSPPNSTKASYVDGTRRFDSIREVNKLQKERAETPNKESRREMAKEIRRLGGRID